MHFYIIAISFYINYSMFCQVKKPHLSKIKPVSMKGPLLRSRGLDMNI